MWPFWAPGGGLGVHGLEHRLLEIVERFGNFFQIRGVAPDGGRVATRPDAYLFPGCCEGWPCSQSNDPVALRRGAASGGSVFAVAKPHKVANDKHVGGASMAHVGCVLVCAVGGG